MEEEGNSGVCSCQAFYCNVPWGGQAPAGRLLSQVASSLKQAGHVL